MNMKVINTVFSSALIGTALVLTGCGGGGSGGGGSSATATVPANAVVINNSNAETTVSSASSSASTVKTAFAADTPANVDLKDKLHTVNQVIADHTTNSGVAVASGATVGCTGGGTVTVTGDDLNGTASFSNCVEYGYTFNGNLAYNSTSDSTTGDYSDSASGSFSMEDTASGFKFSFAGLNFAETGNHIADTYTISAFTFSVDFISGGVSGGGFLAELLAPIVESSGGSYSCPESGDILITGANGTTAEGIFNGDDTMTIKANGRS